MNDFRLKFDFKAANSQSIEFSKFLSGHCPKIKDYFENIFQWTALKKTIKKKTKKLLQLEICKVLKKILQNESQLESVSEMEFRFSFHDSALLEGDKRVPSHRHQ
jgi:hypothetical protein